jgi:hypothetical protein
MARLLAQGAKKELRIDIHPCAEKAYQFFLSQTSLFNKNKFSLASLEDILEGHVFNAIHCKANQYQLISGFNVIGFSINQVDFKKHQIIIYENLSDTDIESHAWKCTLRSLLTSISSHHLEVFRKSLNQHAPSHIIKQIFASKSLTQQQLSTIADISVSGLKKQPLGKKSTSFENDDPKQSGKQHLIIFERLIRESKNGS